MPEEASSQRVSTLELFFDLVFVFTITQVATILERRASWTHAAQALLELAVIFWMYGGFAWLTNTLGTRTQRQRAVLLLGMAAFLTVSLAVPRAFGEDGVAFGWAYLVLNVVHLAGFLIGTVPSAAAAMRRVGSTNLLAAGLVLAAGYAGAPWHWALWGGAILVQWGPPLVTRRVGSFTIDIGPWAERHGLMVIIALGESLVSVALAAQSLPVRPGLVAGVLCGLASSAAMWWCYFAGEDDRAAESFARLPAARRGWSALVGYDLPHLLMLGGIVAVAAGTRISLPDLGAPASRPAAVLLAGGAALYLVALAGWRLVIGSGPPLSRAVTALLVLATIPVGTGLGAAQQLAAIAALIAAMVLLERAADARGRAPQGDPAG